jgi:hypothetical protein
MVRLDELNGTCAARVVARARPSQVACRVTGNRRGPCALDPICAPADRLGLWVFYGALTTAGCLALTIVFWVLRLTRIGRLLGFAGRFFLPPVRWGLGMLGAAKRFYDGLPF